MCRFNVEASVLVTVGNVFINNNKHLHLFVNKRTIRVLFVFLCVRYSNINLVFCFMFSPFSFFNYSQLLRCTPYMLQCFSSTFYSHRYLIKNFLFKCLPPEGHSRTGFFSLLLHTVLITSHVSCRCVASNKYTDRMIEITICEQKMPSVTDRSNWMEP